MTGGPTLEIALYVLAVIIGGLVRLALLDTRPLTVEEGSMATQAYRLMLGQPGERFLDGPLPTYGTALFLALFAGGDGVARLLSVVAGTVMVGVPYLLRSSLGRTAALASAFLLALSPVLLFASRTVGSGIVPAVLSLLLWWAASERDGIGGRKPYSVALLVGALIASGAGGITCLLALGLAALLSHPEPSVLVSDARANSTSQTWRRAAAVCAGTVILLGTGLGFNLKGVQSVLVDGWSAWLTSINLSSPRGSLLLILGMYELPILVLALARLLWTLFRRERIDMMLSLWAMVLLLVGMMQPASGISRMVLPMVPLYLLASRALAGSMRFARGATFSWRWNVGAIALASPILVALVFLNRATILSQEIPQEFIYGEVAITVAAALILALVVPGQMRKPLAWYGLVVLGGAFWIHTAFFLNYRNETASSELLAGQQISSQLRAVAVEAAYYSTHYNSAVAVDPQLRPYLDWYLRGAKSVIYSQETTQGMSIGLDQIPPGELPAGSERAPGIYSPALDGAATSWQGLWSWAMARGGMVRPNPRDIIFRTPISIW